MRTERMWDDFSGLPVEAQTQVVEFVAFLKQRYKKARTRKQVLPELSQEPFIGMWADRTDMEDSTAWVRELREREWKA